jgi:signal transduction histidine kinase
VTVRTFLLLTALGLLAATTVAGYTGWVIETHRQHNALDHRLERTHNLVADQLRNGSPRVTGKLDRALADLRVAARAIRSTSATKRLVYENPNPAITTDPDVEVAHYRIAGNRPSNPGTVFLDVSYVPDGTGSRLLASLVAGAAGLVLALGVAALLAGRYLVAPIHALRDRVDRIAGGDMADRDRSWPIAELRDVTNAVDGMATQLRVTHDKELETEEARRFLIASIAHDVRSPLFALRGYLEAIETNVGPASTYLPRVREKADTIDRLISRLFSYTRAEYLGEPPTLQLTDVGTLVHEVLDGWEQTLRHRQLRVDLAGPVVSCRLDRERTRRALDNLIENALHHAESLTTINIHWGREGENVVIRVIDDGPGIPPEVLPNVFDPFVRSPARNGDHATSAGLGLAIARRLIESQGGQLEAASPSDGGAVLTMRLPTPEHRAMAPSRSGHSP